MGPMTIRKKQVVAYTVVVAVCYGLFWVLGGAAMFYSMLVQFFVLPLSHFFLALWMGLEKSWKERQWWLLLYFGFGYFLMQYGTFSLLNMVSAGKFNPPEPELFLLGAACALPGMALGSVIRWGRGLPAAPQDRRRPLWAFGLVWGGVRHPAAGAPLAAHGAAIPRHPAGFLRAALFPLGGSHGRLYGPFRHSLFRGELQPGADRRAGGRISGGPLLPVDRAGESPAAALFGAAGALALGVGGSQGGVVDYMGLDQGTSLLLLPLGYLAGQVLPGAGLGAGMLVARRKNPVDKPQP